MHSSILMDYYEDKRKQMLNGCIQCGHCYRQCSLNGHILKEVTPREAQQKVLTFLRERIEDAVVYERAFSCLQCFKCVDVCPKGLNPMIINEWVKWEYRKKNAEINQYVDPGHEKSPHRILSRIQSTEAEYGRITKKTEKYTQRCTEKESNRDTIEGIITKKKKYIFFPGCNVYFQPDKILNAMDILERITQEVKLLPGLDYCCGNGQLFYGDVEGAGKAMEELVKQLVADEPQTVILWCPTCLCRFETMIKKLFDLPFKVISFPEFVANHMDNLTFREQIDKGVTYHQACKSAFIGRDNNTMREILQKMPGVNLLEMKRHGAHTVCCGLGAKEYSPEIMQEMRDSRLKEAEETNAEILVDVCHACHQLFLEKEQEYRFQIINYVSLLAKALGIEREDKLKTYLEINDVDTILDQIATVIGESPYSREEIKEAIQDNIL